MRLPQYQHHGISEHVHVVVVVPREERHFLETLKHVLPCLPHHDDVLAARESVAHLQVPTARPLPMSHHRVVEDEHVALVDGLQILERLLMKLLRCVVQREVQVEPVR